MKGADKEEPQFTGAQKDVLVLILDWLREKEFSAADLKAAEDIWARYVKADQSKITNKKAYAAAVIYALGRTKGHGWLQQRVLAGEFGVSSGNISKHWQAIREKLFEKERLTEKNGESEQTHSDFFNPIAAEVFRKLMVYTQRSERWKSYVGEVFFKFVGTEAPPLPIDLILELLIFITCDRTLPDGKKIVDFFLTDQEGKFSAEEKSFLRKIKASRFGLYEVKSCEIDLNQSRLEVEDLYRDLELKLMVRDATGIDEGDIIMSRIIPSNDDDIWKIGGNLVTLHPPAVRELEELARRWFWEFSVANKGWATGEMFIQENSFRFWRWLLGH